MWPSNWILCRLQTLVRAGAIENFTVCGWKQGCVGNGQWVNASVVSFMNDLKLHCHCRQIVTVILWVHRPFLWKKWHYKIKMGCEPCFMLTWNVVDKKLGMTMLCFALCVCMCSHVSAPASFLGRASTVPDPAEGKLALLLRSLHPARRWRCAAALRGWRGRVPRDHGPCRNGD